MPFSIDVDNPGALLARMQPHIPDPAEIQAANYKLQQMRDEQAMAPMRREAMAQELQGLKYQNQERQLGLQEAQAVQQTLADPKYRKDDGTLDYSSAISDMAGRVRPKTLMELQGLNDAHIEKTSTAKKNIAEAGKLTEDTVRAHKEYIGEQAQKVKDSGYSPAVADMFLTILENENPQLYAPHMEGVRQQFQQDPNSIKALIDGLTTQKSETSSAELAAKRAATAETKQKVEIGGYDIAARTVPTDVDAPDFQQRYSAWYAGQPDAVKRQVPAMGSAAAVDKARRLGVSVEKQPEFDLNSYKAKMGLVGNSEYDQFLVQYARSLGKTPAQLTPDEGLASFEKFAELKQDKTMRDLAISQRTLAQTLSRAQLAQMPTDADYQTLAKSLLDHSISPTQFNELKAGRMGQISPTKVFLIAKQMNPNFSMANAENEFKAMEKTEADFTSGKEAGLVRSNNNAIEHLALLEEARKALANNDVPVLARIANYFGTQTGGTAATVYDHIAARVGDEVQKAFIPGGGSAGERVAAGTGSYSSKMGDAQNAANIRADLRLMDSQQRHLVDQYKRGTYGQGGQQLFTPEAMNARDRILGTQQSTVPAGKIAVISPEGVSGYIDADKWEAAKARGFKRQ